ALPGARGCWPGTRAALTAPPPSAAVEVGLLGQGAARDDDGMTVDDPFVARLPAPNELDHLDQEEQRHEATGQESKQQESKHARSMAACRVGRSPCEARRACSGLSIRLEVSRSTGAEDAHVELGGAGP